MKRHPMIAPLALTLQRTFVATGTATSCSPREGLMNTTTPVAQTPANAHAQPVRRDGRLVRTLLLCGILATLLYVALDVGTALRYGGYSYLDQWVSELSAIDAPTRPIWLVVGPVYQLFMVFFGIGVWLAARERRSLRIAAGLVIAYGFVGFTAPFTPMHTREFLAVYGPTLTDRLHIVNTAIAVLLIFASIGFAAAAFGTYFRVYSIATLALSFAFGMWTSRMAPNVEANLPTPWGGVIERTSMVLFMGWVVVLALALLLRPPVQESGR
jgi:hypothetical protein